MSEWQKVKIGDFLKRIKRPVFLEDDKEYKLVTIQLHHKGVKLRGHKKGEDIKSKMYEVKSGDFILSGIDARNGAFGIVEDDLNGAIVTNDFWYFELNKELIDKHFFLELTSTRWFDEICRLGSDGTTQRIRLQKGKFFDQEIYLPPIEKQKEFAKKLISIKQKRQKLDQENILQKSHLTLLRQQILQDAISGKLTTDWRAENPDAEPASELLKQIKVEKEKLITEKKIKKEKPLPKIVENKVPFELPEGWEWCRFIDIANIASKLVSPDKYQNYLQVAPDCIEKGTGKLIEKRTVQDAKIISANHFFISNTLIYSKVRPKLNKIVFVDFEGLCSADMYPIEPFCDAQYLQKVMLSEYFLSEVDKYDNRVKMPKLNQKQLNSIRIPLPPRAEQRAIVAKVERLMGYISQLEEKIAQNANNAETLMQAFLGEVFRK